MLGFNALVTPDEIKFTGPFMERANRFTREWGAHRFLRVEFDTGKDGDHKIRQYQSATAIYRRVLKNGIRFGGRHFEFLAYSASQLREHKTYFFASKGDDLPEDCATAETVRRWAGDFKDVTTLPKYAARMGQAFSSTDPTIKVRNSVSLSYFR